MTLGTALRLGRVSNLPTVWSNVLAGAVLAGGPLEPVALLILAVAASAMYVGGMYLNDAFDADIDARERPERPIPAGEVSRRTVYKLGFALLAVALVTITANAVLVTEVGWTPTLATLGTAAMIVLYNAWHKGNPIGPAIMGLCRVGLYLIAATSITGTVGTNVLLGALLLLGYVLGLTYVAKFETSGSIARYWPLAGLLAPLAYMLPLIRGAAIIRILISGYGLWVKRSFDFVRRGKGPDIRNAVVSLIAGISLLDAMLIARSGPTELVFVAIGAFGATLALQRKIAGT